MKPINEIPIETTVTLFITDDSSVVYKNQSILDAIDSLKYVVKLSYNSEFGRVVSVFIAVDNDVGRMVALRPYSQSTWRDSLISEQFNLLVEAGTIDRDMTNWSTKMDSMFTIVNSGGSCSIFNRSGTESYKFENKNLLDELTQVQFDKLTERLEYWNNKGMIFFQKGDSASFKHIVAYTYFLQTDFDTAIPALEFSAMLGANQSQVMLDTIEKDGLKSVWLQIIQDELGIIIEINGNAGLL